MTPITAPPPATAVPDAIVAPLGQAPVQQPATGLRQGGRDGPLRNGNPRGNPHLAPRCGAKVRTTGCSCRAPAMANGRCRSHGGKSTGPRTAEGRARVATANTTHGNYAQAGHGAKLRVAERQGRVLARRMRLMAAAYRNLRWLPRALAARVQADEVPELRATVNYVWLLDELAAEAAGSSAPGQAQVGQAQVGQAQVGQALVGQALCKAGRDARGRFAAAPPPVLHGRKAELARAHAEAAALAPWKAGIARARMAKRVMKSQDRAARLAKPGRGKLHGLPTLEPATGHLTRWGTRPGGGTVRPNGAPFEGSDRKSMNSGAGGGPTRVRAEARAVLAPPAALTRAAALVHGRGAPFEGSDRNSLNSGAGGGTAGSRADAPVVLAPSAALIRAAALAHGRGAPFEGSDRNSLNSGAGGGPAGLRADAPPVLAPQAALIRAAAARGAL